jgi:pimeloyl-ACP methyl ester carboxylesterase
MRTSDLATTRSRRSGPAPKLLSRRLVAGALAALLISLLSSVPTVRAAGLPVFASSPDDAAEFTGDWRGSLSVGGNELSIVFHIESADDGKLTATMDSPDQGARGIPVASVEVRVDSLRLDIRAASAVYVGRMVGDGEIIEGEWRQGGTRLPLTVKRGQEGGSDDREEMEEPRRPQEPEPPHPYGTESVRIDVPGFDVTLAGTLTIPPGEPYAPAVVLASGSGPQDRDGTVAGHRLFLVLADHLTRRGVAVLRFDDPGVGGSTGSYFDSTLEDRAAGVLAAVRLLRERSEIDPDRIGVLGHSEGGWVASLAAARAPEAIAFAVLMAGPAQNPTELLLTQQREMLAARGAGEAEIEARDAFLAGNLDIIRASPDAATARARLLARRTRILEELPHDERAALEAYLAGQSDAERDRLLWIAGTSWFRHLLAFDAGGLLRTMDQPALALFGARDLQVPAKENAPFMERLLNAERRTDRAVRVLPGLNHLFQPAETGLPAEYGRIATTLAPAALEAVSGWIARVIGDNSASGGPRGRSSDHGVARPPFFD